MDDKNFQLLTMIENIDTVTEYAELDVMVSLYSEYEKLGYFIENSTDISDDSNIALIMEGAFGDTVKKGFGNVVSVLKKLWGLIVSFFNMCKRALGKIFSKLKNKSGAKKTVNQVLRDMEKSGKISKMHKQIAESVNNSGKKVIDIPASDVSDNEYKNQRVIYSNRAWNNTGPKIEIVIMDDGSQAVQISGVSKSQKNIQESTQQISDTRETSNFEIFGFQLTGFYVTLRMEKEILEYDKHIKEFLQKTFDIIKDKNAKPDQIEALINDIKKASEDFKAIRSNTFKALKDEKRSYDNIIISMDEFSRFQHINDSCADSMKTIPEICSLIEKIPESIHATSLNDAFDKQDAKNKLCKVVINELDMYLKTISSDQMLLNKIAAQFTTDEMQLPDPEFFGTINTFEAFDNLIASLIESHIPQKFVMYSSWLLTSDNIKGQSEEYKPIWGQFRGCFFPPQENFIYKFALSKSAVIDNKNEVKINEYLKGKNKNDMIAQILDHGPTYSVIKMEKLYGIGEIPQNTEEYIDYFDSKLGYEKFVFKDLHSNNIGFRTKKPNNDYTVKDNPVIVDYGMLNLRENH